MGGTPIFMYFLLEPGGPGAVVKVACLESRRSRVRTPARPLSFKETNKLRLI